MVVRGNNTAFNAADFARRLKQALDTETTTPDTTKQVRALTKLDPAKQSEVLKAFDAMVSKSELADYKEALERIGAQIGASMAFLAQNKIVEGGSAAGKSQDNTLELRKTEGAKRKPPAAKTSTEPLMDGAEKIADTSLKLNETAKAQASPKAKAAVDKLAKQIEKSAQKLTEQAGKAGMNFDKVQREIAKLRATGPEGAAKADAIAARLHAMGLGFAKALEADPAKSASTAPATPAPKVGAAPLPTAATSAAAVAPSAAATATPNADFAKAAAEQRSISRSQSILNLINSGAPIEYILMAVMMLFLEDSDDELKQKLADQMAKQKEVEALRNEQTALENNDEAALAKLGVPKIVAPIVQPVVKAVKLNELENKEEKLEKEIAKTEAAIAATPPPAPAAPTPVEQAVASTAGEVLEGADKAVGSQSEATSDEKKKAQNDAAKSGAASGSVVNSTPAAIAAQQKATAQNAAVVSTDAKVAAKNSAAQTPGTDTQTPTAPDATPAPSPEELRQKRLNVIANELRNRGDSSTQTQMEVQQLMERRSNMVELVSKLMSQISQMLSTITHNI